MLRVHLALAAMVLVCPAVVPAATIDFEGSDPVASGEFTIAGEDSGIYAIDDFGLFATTVFGWCAQDCTSGGGEIGASKTKSGWGDQSNAGKSSHPQVVTLKRADDAPFSLSQLDAAPLFNADDDNPLVVTGFLDGGGTVTQNLTLSDVPNELQTYNLSEFTDVVRVEFTKLDTAPDLQDAAIDNLVVDEGAPAVSLTPASIDFGIVDLATGVSSSIVTVTNTGTAPLEITGLSGLAEPFSVTGGTCQPLPVTLAVDESCTIEITFAPDRQVRASDTLLIESNAPTSPDSVAVLAESELTAAIPALDWRGILVMMLAMMGGVFFARRQLG